MSARSIKVDVKRPHLLASMPNGVKYLVRMGVEGGAIEVYRLTYGRWLLQTYQATPQIQVDGFKFSITPPPEAGAVMNKHDARRLLKAHPPPWEDAQWDARDEAAWRDDDSDRLAERAENRALKGE